MKKFIVALAAMAMTAGFSMSAQDCKKECKQDCKATECTAEKCDAKKQCAPRACMFDGLNLTDAQKSQLQEIGKKQCEARKAKAEDKKQRKEARKQQRKDFLAEVKAVLTPEQYVQFLENNFMSGKGDNAPKCERKDNRKDDRKGQRPQGPRGQRPDRAAAAQPAN